MYYIFIAIKMWKCEVKISIVKVSIKAHSEHKYTDRMSANQHSLLKDISYNYAQNLEIPYNNNYSSWDWKLSLFVFQLNFKYLVLRVYWKDIFIKNAADF